MTSPATHDSIYQRLFGHLIMLLGLLRNGAGSFRLSEEWLEVLDFNDVVYEPTVSVDKESGERRADLVASVGVRTPDGVEGKGWRRVLFEIEFQSSPNSKMPWRFNEYVHRARSRVVLREGEEETPVAFSMLVYSGEEEWNVLTHSVPSWFPLPVEEVERMTGSVLRYHLVDILRCRIEDLPEDGPLTWWFRLERAKSKEELLEALEGAFRLLRPMGRTGEDLRDLFLERAGYSRWGAFLKGMSPRRIRRFWRKGAEKMTSALEMRAERWFARHDAGVRTQALRKGVKQGIEQARAEQRAQLCDMAKARFGADTAQRLAELIEHINDPARLSRIGQWLVTCETGAEFLARIANGHLPNGESSD